MTYKRFSFLLLSIICLLLSLLILSAARAEDIDWHVAGYVTGNFAGGAGIINLTQSAENVINNEAMEGLGLPPLLTTTLPNKEVTVMAKKQHTHVAEKRQPVKYLEADLIGKQFGLLTIIEESESHRKPSGGISRMFLCKCLCGNTKIIRLGSIIEGSSRSCGCLSKQALSDGRTTHNLSKHKLHYAWNSMLQRCYNENNPRYKNYGARGIRVCKEWKKSYVPFYEWAIDAGWKDDLYLDRKDVNDGYRPDNCRFVGKYKSCQNTTLLNSVNTSGYRGVYFNKEKKKWHSEIGYNGKRYRLGYFDTAKAAAMAYDAKVHELGSEHPLNFVKT